MRSKVIIGAAILVTVVCVAAAAFLLFRTCCELPSAPGQSASVAPLVGAMPAPEETAKAEPPPAEVAKAEPAPERAPDGKKADTASGGSASADDAPSFDIVRIEPNGDGVIAGRAAPGWKVGVESGGVRLAEVTADDEGAWTVVLDKPLAVGAHKLSLKAVSPDGGKSLASSQTVPVAVSASEAKSAGPETVASVAAAETKLAAGEASSSLEPASAGEAVASKPNSAAVGTRAGVAQSSSAEAQLAEAKAQGQPLSPHAVTPDEVAAGKPAAALPQTASVENGRQVSPSTLPEQLKPGTYTIQRGDTLWAIAERYLGAGWRYTSIYRDNRKIIKNPNLIRPEQQVSVPGE